MLFAVEFQDLFWAEQKRRDRWQKKEKKMLVSCSLRNTHTHTVIVVTELSVGSRHLTCFMDSLEQPACFVDSLEYWEIGRNFFHMKTDLMLKKTKLMKSWQMMVYGHML